MISEKHFYLKCLSRGWTCLLWMATDLFISRKFSQTRARFRHCIGIGPIGWPPYKTPRLTIKYKRPTARSTAASSEPTRLRIISPVIHLKSQFFSLHHVYSIECGELAGETYFISKCICRSGRTMTLCVWYRRSHWAEHFPAVFDVLQ